MTQDEIIELAIQGHAGTRDAIRWAMNQAILAEREKVAAWMMQRAYATGHGDTIEDLLKELEWQIAEREREACAKVCEEQYEYYGHDHVFANAIRNRSNT